VRVCVSVSIPTYHASLIHAIEGVKSELPYIHTLQNSLIQIYFPK